MKFFHHKYQCYVVGEGSFVGHCGNLLTLAEDEEAESDALGKKSLTSPNEVQVTVDVEPSKEEEATSRSAAKPSLSSDQGSQSGQASSFDDDGSSIVSHPKTPVPPVGDEVVCEDGELWLRQ